MLKARPGGPRRADKAPGEASAVLTSCLAKPGSVLKCPVLSHKLYTQLSEEVPCVS